MAERRTEVQVGLALVLALVVLVFGLMWFEEYQLGAEYQRVEVVFDRVGGLGAGDPVEVRGLSKGKVSSVALDPEGVLVVLRLHGDVTLHDDAVITLGSAGIMGERMVSIEPGRGVALDPTQTRFEGIYEAATTELVGQVEQFNEKVMSFLENADALLVDLRREGALVSTLRSTGDATTAAAELLRSNREDMGRIAANTAALTERIVQFLDQHEESMGRGVVGLARVTDSFDSLAVQMSQVLDDTQSILTALKDQKGPAGRLIFDEAAGEDLVKTLERMRFLVEDLQRNPERYLTVKIF